MNSIALNIEPHHYLAGWRAEAGSLFLPALSESRVGEHVVARIGLFGQPVRATIYGKVAMVRRVGRPSLPPGVEIHLDRASVPAARYLAAVASGEPLSFQVRAPRYALERAVLVTARRTTVQARTLTLSEGRILEALLQQPGEPLDKQALAQLALGRKLTLYDRRLDMHVSNLRKKLGPHPDGRPRIVALRSRGYYYAP